MNLLALLPFIDQAQATGGVDCEVTSITQDSRQAGPGVAFFAIRGQAADGHDYIPNAIKAGSPVIFAETDILDEHTGAWVRVKDARLAYGQAAAALHAHPALQLKLAGVTGTNGKSTIALLLQHLMGGRRVGLIGTIGYQVGDGTVRTSNRTTPDAYELQGLLSEMVSNGCNAAAMEVSSHALHQHRVAGIEFDCAIFTNLTQDHLDYHRSMEEYFQAKALFATLLGQQLEKKKPCLVVNMDDPYGKRLVEMCAKQNRGVRVLTYGSSYNADYRFTDISSTMLVTQFTLEHKGRQFLVKVPLLGKFNIYNVLACVAAMHGMGYNLRATIEALPDLPQVPGRMESVGKQRDFKVIVDYAHTPDALDNALKTLRGLSPRRLITVFGCGGGRDRTKRPLMAAAAEQYSDQLILTSDNPRDEDPEQILQDMVRGLSGRVPAVSILDRELAIAHAIEHSRRGDIILIAGKGHEKEQIFANGEKVPFDDVRVASAYIKELQQSQADQK